MSVIVKGMKKPQSCWDCDIGPAFQLDDKHCPFYEMEGQEQENYQNKIAEGCPISNIPTPHGRLIDADFLGKILKREAEDEWNKNASPFSWSYAYECLMNDLNIMPTIIEAEE